MAALPDYGHDMGQNFGVFWQTGRYDSPNLFRMESDGFTGLFASVPGAKKSCCVVVTLYIPARQNQNQTIFSGLGSPCPIFCGTTKAIINTPLKEPVVTIHPGFSPEPFKKSRRIV